MYQLYRNTFISVMMLLLCQTAYAQQRQVTGNVRDASGAPMPGVNVLIRGTTAGTATDANGSFSIQAAESDVLVLSFIGYQTQEIAVGTQTNIEIELSEDLTTLTELVVVGYGVQKKVLNTGANLQVKGEDLQKLSTTNALQALQGQAPGVQITSTSGQPGEPLKVIVRGLGTIANAGPLYVVDGVITGDISYLNPADIESIDVLKDAASAAIYGSQAANGVVLITTRKGRVGTNAQITFDAFYGVQNLAKKTDLLNAREYATLLNEAAVNSGKLPYYTSEEIAAMGTGTDWLGTMFVDNAPTQSYTLGVTGGSAASVYSASLAYLSQAGIVGGTDLSNYERYNFRFNSEHKLYEDVITFGQNLSFAYVENNGIAVGNQYNNTMRGAFNTTPLLANDLTDTVGMFNQANPYHSMLINNQNRRNNQKLVGNIYVEAELLKGLKLRSSIGLDYFARDEHSFTPEYVLSVYSFNRDSRVNQSFSKGRTWLWDNLISYGFNFAGDHHIDAMAGTSAFQYRGSSMWGTNTNVVFNDVDHAWLSNATNTDGARITIGGRPDDEDNRFSYFGRVNYNFRETYLLNATFRADGSSRFAPGNRWGYFPSVSAGWVVTNASFLSGSNNWLDFLKVRASWGQVGNQNVRFFNYLAPVTFENTNYIFGPEEGVLTPGAYPNRLANPDVRWETSEQANIGFDARFVAGKVNVSFDWYNKTTKDWLVVAPIPATAGADAPYVNGGDVINSGVELALSYSNSGNAFSYTIGANGAYNRNKVGNIPTQDGIIHGATNQLFDNSGEFYRAESGFPIGYFWGLQTNGIFQSEAEVAAHRSDEGTLIQPDASPGDVRYIDRDGNGVINEDDKTLIGNPNPDFTFGLSFSCNFKGFDLSVLASGVTGNQIVQSYRNHANQYSNYTSAILDRWHGPGSSNTVPRVTENNNNWATFSDLYIHDGDYLRINNITLGYDFTKLMKVKFMSQLRLYASVLNLHTFTKYNGMDPEIGYGIDNGETDKFSSGIDLGYYPRPRTFLAGVNVKF